LLVLLFSLEVCALLADDLLFSLQHRLDAFSSLCNLLRLLLAELFEIMVSVCLLPLEIRVDIDELLILHFLFMLAELLEVHRLLILHDLLLGQHCLLPPLQIVCYLLMSRFKERQTLVDNEFFLLFDAFI
jgi:hypothetical protein